MTQGLGILRLGFLPTLLTCGFLNAGGTTRAAPVDTQYMTNVLLFENGLFQSQDPQGPESLDPITSAVDQSDGQGTAQASQNGSLFVSSILDRNLLQTGTTSSLDPPQAQDPDASLEVGTTSTWSKTVLNSSGAAKNYQANFNVVNPFLQIDDHLSQFIVDAAGDDDLAGNEFVAQVTMEIRIDSTLVYDVQATLKALGTSESFVRDEFINVQNAALPNFVNTGDGNAGTNHVYEAESFTVSLDVGPIADGETFEISYKLTSLATSPEFGFLNPVSALDDEAGYGGFHVEAEISDPFALGGDDNPVIVEITNENVVPEPSGLLLAVLACCAMSVARRHKSRRSRKE